MIHRTNIGSEYEGMTHQNGRPTVSIVMLVGGTRRFLDMTLASVLAQTFRDFELILVCKEGQRSEIELYPFPDILFHRLSKLNFLGENYCRGGESSTLMAEVTFRSGSYLSTFDRATIEKRVADDLVKLGFINQEDIVSIETRSERYAYVIYDLDHRKNVDRVLGYLRESGIECVGRFAEFEYLNSDGVVEHTLKLAERLNANV